MNIDLNNMDVVVTGGTGALGTAVVRLILAAGARCHVPVRPGQELPDWPLAAEAGVHLTTGVDLTRESDVEEFYAGVVGEYGPLWASLHAAGGFAMEPARSTSRADFMHQFEMNALTCFLCCREAVKAMGDGSGRIVNVAARPALEPRTGAGMTAYTVSKSAVAALTVALAEEVVGQGILVNAVVPSIMDTPANRQAMPAVDYARWITVEDVAATMVFLASPLNTCTRGALVCTYGHC